MHRPDTAVHPYRAAAAIATVAGLLAAAPAAAAPRTAAPYRVAPAVWSPCPAAELIKVPNPERYSCTTVAVPLDHRHPGRGTIDIALMRRSADDPARRIGSLFINPGGPGASGFRAPTDPAGASAEVKARFDLIGFDPRGVARSAPLRCFTTKEEANAVLPWLVGIGTDLDHAVRAHHTYARACRDNGGPLLHTMSTGSVARDLDLLRQAVGEERMNYVGASYGTLLGATYVNLFPHRARGIVLDGNVDPVLRTRDGLEYLRQRALGQEPVMTAFLARCAEVGARCPFGTGDPAAKFTTIRDRLHRGPLTVPGHGVVTLSSFSKLVPESLNRPVLYANLASFLQAAYEAVRSAPEPATAAPPAAPPGAPPVAGATPYTGDDSRLAVHCLDEPFPTGDAPFLEAVNSWPRQAPTTGATHAVSQLACGHWPARDRNRYAGPWNRRTPTPVLLVGNYRDPATNYVFSQRMAAALGNARLVSVDAFGHTILGHSACADAITTRYLTDLTVPPPGVVCQPDRQPFD